MVDYKCFAKLLFLFGGVLMLPACETLSTETGDYDDAGGAFYTEPVKNSNVESALQAGPSASSDVLVALLRYGRYIGDLSAAELRKEYKRVMTQYRSHPEDGIRIRLAILIGNPGMPYSDISRALEILDEISKRSATVLPAYKEFAAYQVAVLQQYQRQQQGTLAVNEQLKREKQKRQKLQQQLNALKSIEQSLSNRN